MIIKKILKIILWIWQLPQHLIALLIFAQNKIRKGVCKKLQSENITWYKIKYIYDSGICLGNYIILDSDKYVSLNDVKHEFGHSIQSKIFGPFYLIVVGIPSIVRNIFNRFFHKKWTYLEKNKWYYSGYPENWADKLGKVNRF